MFRINPPLETISNVGEKKFSRIVEGSFKTKTYFALHSLGLANLKRKVYGEADFILITDMGIICVEVKGGSVERDKGVWTIGNTYNSREGPFAQSEKTIHPVMEHLRSNDFKRAKKFAVGWGVSFPDICFKTRDPGWSDYQVFDQEALRSFEDFLTTFFVELKKHLSQTMSLDFNNNITLDDMKWAVRCLRPDISVMSLNSIQSSKSELIRLEEKQKVLVDQLIYGVVNRSVIFGGPGTGKTLVLLETVLNINKEDDILLVCYNVNLANYFRKILSGQRNVTVRTYYQIVKNIINNEDLSENEIDVDVNKYFKEVLPKYLETALIEQSDSGKLKTFNWVLVDEAQDLPSNELLETMNFLLKSGLRSGNFVLAVDQNIQAKVYNNFQNSSMLELEKFSSKVPFLRNYRNPRAIAKRAAKLVGDEDIKTAREFPGPPKFHHSKRNPDSLIDKLDELVDELLRNGAKIEEVTVLTFNKYSQLKYKRSISGYQFLEVGTEELGKRNKQFSPLYWSTINGFKGLENEIIITIAPQKDVLDDWTETLLYIALTRVKTEFHYIGERDDAIWRAIS